MDDLKERLRKGCIFWGEFDPQIHEGETDALMAEAAARIRDLEAQLAARDAEKPSAAQVTAGSKVLRDSGFSGDCYHTARLMHRAMIAVATKARSE